MIITLFLTPLLIFMAYEWKQSTKDIADILKMQQQSKINKFNMGYNKVFQKEYNKEVTTRKP